VLVKYLDRTEKVPISDTAGLGTGHRELMGMQGQGAGTKLGGENE
jgi:hypothetical protein